MKCKHCDQEFATTKRKSAHMKSFCKHEDSPNMIKERLKKVKEMEPVREQSAMPHTHIQFVHPIEDSIPMPIPTQSIQIVVTPSLPSIDLPSTRYAHETAKQSENWVSIAQGCKGLSDVNEAITKHLLVALCNVVVVMVVVYAVKRRMIATSNTSIHKPIHPSPRLPNRCA